LRFAQGIRAFIENQEPIGGFSANCGHLSDESRGQDRFHRKEAFFGVDLMMSRGVSATQMSILFARKRSCSSLSAPSSLLGGSFGKRRRADL